MIDWDMLAKLTGGGFAVTFLVLIVLCLVVWAIGLAVQRFGDAGGNAQGGKKK